MKNKKNIQFVFKRILLASLFVVSIFSAFNFGKALASIDDIVITNATIVDKSTTTDATITNFNRDGLETSVIYRMIAIKKYTLNVSENNYFYKWKNKNRVNTFYFAHYKKDTE